MQIDLDLGGEIVTAHYQHNAQGFDLYAVENEDGESLPMGLYKQRVEYALLYSLKSAREADKRYEESDPERAFDDSLLR